MISRVFYDCYMDATQQFVTNEMGHWFDGQKKTPVVGGDLGQIKTAEGALRRHVQLSRFVARVAISRSAR
ncbi:hypothetical protein [Kordiimonas marina]|uniref:hypothetical protein n=1 Tax=Kordiimonas marina TaxID=2872312 RepID=UPI001FF6A56D|nr:hypothetical protein [Kordiimonas marina]MCJ9430120.1 hypothetical protein [Kordiimonas marina]